jgi:hypothetical protein
VGRRRRRQSAGASEDLAKHRPATRQNVKDHEHGSRKVSRQAGDQACEGLDTAGGRPDDDDVALQRLLVNRVRSSRCHPHSVRRPAAAY